MHSTYVLVLITMCIHTEERLDLVEAFVSDLSLRRTLQDCLKIVPDYFRLSKKINRGKGSLQVTQNLYVHYMYIYVRMYSVQFCQDCIANYQLHII